MTKHLDTVKTTTCIALVLATLAACAAPKGAQADSSAVRDTSSQQGGASLPTGNEPIYRHAIDMVSAQQLDAKAALNLRGWSVGLISGDVGCSPSWIPNALGQPAPQGIPVPTVGLILGFADKASLKEFAKAAVRLGSQMTVRDELGAELGSVPVCAEFMAEPTIGG